MTSLMEGFRGPQDIPFILSSFEMTGVVVASLIVGCIVGWILGYYWFGLKR